MEISIETIKQIEKNAIPEYCYKHLDVEYICNGKMEFQSIRSNKDRTAVIIKRKCNKCGRIQKVTQGYFT